MYTTRRGQKSTGLWVLSSRLCGGWDGLRLCEETPPAPQDPHDVDSVAADTRVSKYTWGGDDPPDVVHVAQELRRDVQRLALGYEL